MVQAHGDVVALEGLAHERPEMDRVVRPGRQRHMVHALPALPPAEVEPARRGEKSEKTHIQSDNIDYHNCHPHCLTIAFLLKSCAHDPLRTLPSLARFSVE